MELRSVAAVIKRHRVAAAGGVALALLLAFVAAYRVDLASARLERRQATTYQSTARLFVTQQGFPWGRSALQYTTDKNQPPVAEGDPNRFGTLAVLYAQLANGDRLRSGFSKIDREAVVAQAVPVAQFSDTPLPLVDITAKSESPAHAQFLAATVTKRFVEYIRQNQSSSGIPVSQRVVLEMVEPARPGKIVNGPSPALPALVLFTVLFATIGGIFVLDNWRSDRRLESIGDRGIEPVHAAPEPEEDLGHEAAPAAEVRPRIARAGSPPSTLGHRPTLADTESPARRRGIASAAGEE